jgi:hypothetical protein
MKKILIILAAMLLALSACEQATLPMGDANLWVVNSNWEIVKEYRVAESARSLTSLSVVTSEVAAYNSTTKDDQLSIVDDEDDLDIENAPDATIYEAYADTNEIICQVTVARKNLKYERGRAREQMLDHAASSGRSVVLYVDNAPPELSVIVPEPDLRPDYEKYAIYVIDANGAILYEAHPLEGQALADFFMGDTTKTATDWYEFWLRIVQGCWRNDFPTGDKLIYGSLYQPVAP